MPAAPPILLVEDTPSLAMVYETYLRKAGHAVACAGTLAEARAAHRNSRGRVVLLDLMLPDGDGLDLLGEFRTTDPNGKIIVITANGSINRAVEAMKGGAFDFLVKPFDEQRLISTVANAQTEISASDDVAPPAAATRAEPHAADRFRGFIGKSPQMQRVYQTIRDVGRSMATIFITGESGTGKEVAAQALHDVSNRSKGPFIPINCGAIPPDLLESEVFGHLKGSFTGAIADKPGAAATADGGTLFLDEICEMDLALQTKLLRFLQTSMIHPVGAVRPRKVDVRIICATNRDPEAEVRAGRFREDLFYRLHVVPLALPPLRERGEDVVTVGEAFLRQFAEEEGKRFRRLSPEVAQLFRASAWPGNVRQLQNVIRNIVVLHDAPEVTRSMLPAGLFDEAATAGPVDVVEPAVAAQTGGTLADRVAPLIGETLADVEREFIEATVRAHGGSVPKAAKALALSPSTIYRKREGWARR